jgi:hypothetical protein
MKKNCSRTRCKGKFQLLAATRNMQNLSYNTTIYEDYCKMSSVGTVTKEGDRNNKTHKQNNLLNNKIYC